MTEPSVTNQDDRPRVVINGRFLTQRLSGVQRYATEIVMALDRLITERPNTLGLFEWVLATPIGARPLPLEVIQSAEVGESHGHRWEQIDLRKFSKSDRLLCLGNSAPMYRRNQIVVIHDAAVFEFPKSFGARYRIFHKIMSSALARTSKVCTVSLFSRDELSKHLSIPKDTISVTYNGADHIKQVVSDSGILKRLDVENERFILFVGSPTIQKNLSIVVSALRLLRRKDFKLVIAGSLDKGVFQGAGQWESDQVVAAPELSDAEIKGLYERAAALVFPTLYEGFGIPALEAMATGCPVICSDIPVLREICGNAAEFLSPYDPMLWARAIAAAVDSPKPIDRIQVAFNRSREFTWARSAAALSYKIVGEL